MDLFIGLGFFVLSPLFLLTKGWGFFLVCFVSFWNITGLAEQKIHRFGENILFVNGSVTGVFSLPDFWFCSGSEFLLVVSSQISWLMISFYDMSVQHSMQLHFCMGFFFHKDRNPQAKKVSV